MSRKLSPQQLSPRKHSILFTNIPEIDTQILLSLPDDSLESACTINKYAASLCDENFWHQRFIQKFGVTLGKYKRSEEKYKDIYIKFVKLSLDEQLIKASSRGYLSLVKEVLDRGANIHARNDEALRWAAEDGYLDVVKLLLDHDADIHAPQGDDYALRLAAANGHLDVVKFLLDNGANIHADNDNTLRWAAQNGQLEVVKYLLDRGADIHARFDNALLWAVQNGHLDVVKLLLDRGADIIILKNLLPSLDKDLQSKLNKIIEEYETKKKIEVVPIVKRTEVVPITEDIKEITKRILINIPKQQVITSIPKREIIPSMEELREIIRRNDNTIKVGGKGITREYLYNLAKERGWL